MKSGDNAGEYRTGHEIVGKFVDVVVMEIIPVTVIQRSKVRIPSGRFSFPRYNKRSGHHDRHECCGLCGGSRGLQGSSLDGLLLYRKWGVAGYYE
jgi:hypothetical protein